MVDAGVEGRRGEETVVEKRAFEDGVDEEVEGVPDEEDTEGGWSGFAEHAQGEEVGGVEEEEDGGEGDDGGAVEVVHY